MRAGNLCSAGKRGLTPKAPQAGIDAEIDGHQHQNDGANSSRRIRPRFHLDLPEVLDQSKYNPITAVGSADSRAVDISAKQETSDV